MFFSCSIASGSIRSVQTFTGTRALRTARSASRKKYPLSVHAFPAPDRLCAAALLLLSSSFACRSEEARPDHGSAPGGDRVPRDGPRAIVRRRLDDAGLPCRRLEERPDGPRGPPRCGRHRRRDSECARDIGRRVRRQPSDGRVGEAERSPESGAGPARSAERPFRSFSACPEIPSRCRSRTFSTTPEEEGSTCVWRATVRTYRGGSPGASSVSTPAPEGRSATPATPSATGPGRSLVFTRAGRPCLPTGPGLVFSSAWTAGGSEAIWRETRRR